MRYDETNRNVMASFFRGELQIDSPDYMIVEYGEGIGIGNKYGSYSQYTKKLSENKENGKIYIGIATNTNMNSLSPEEKLKLSISPTTKFTVGDTPKVLIMYYNIIHGISIKAMWKDDKDNIILGQYYEIPSPHSMQYSWWDLYGAHFTGPENIEEGNYKIELTTTEQQMSREPRRPVSSTIEFSVSTNDITR